MGALGSYSPGELGVDAGHVASFCCPQATPNCCPGGVSASGTYSASNCNNHVDTVANGGSGVPCTGSETAKGGQCGDGLGGQGYATAYTTPAGPELAAKIFITTTDGGCPASHPHGALTFDQCIQLHRDYKTVVTGAPDYSNMYVPASR